ncbi:MAG: sulfatase [Acidobacteriota bacterium]|nr:sulfatase [Acidobacteriota bacterium]
MILISVDTLRPDRMGIYGYERDTSPNIDRFFGERSIYRRTQSSAPCTRPAVFDFLSGSLMPDERSSEQAGEAQDSVTRTLAEILRDRGFRTAAFTTNQNFSPKRHGRGYEAYVNFEHLTSPEQKQGTAYQVTDRALEWLEEHREESSLHLWVHYFGPHRPFFPPEKVRRYSRTSVVDKALTDHDRKGQTRPQLQAASPKGAESAVASVMQRVPQMTGLSEGVQWHLRGDALSPAQVKHFRDSYDDDILFADEQVGRLLHKLEELRMVEQALIVFTSDHGEWLGEENVWHHCNSLHGRELHVPLLLSLNGHPLTSTIDPRLATSTLDILPTVLDLLDIEAPHAMDGGSIRKLKPRRATISFWRGTFAVTRGRFKLYRGEFKGLFDLANDPDETRDLSESLPDMAEKLGLELAEYADDLPALVQENRELIERLKSLGYL